MTVHAHNDLFYLAEKIFTAAEVDAMVAHLSSEGWPSLAKVGVGQGDSSVGRSALLYWIPRVEASEWLFERVWERVRKWNEDFGYELAGAPGRAQVSCYGPGQKYDWHRDVGPGNTSLRKVSVVVALNSQKDYTGGGLQFFGEYKGSSNPVLNLARGDGAIFNSYIPHRALEVKTGQRWTMTFWFCGTEPFK